MPAFSYKAFDAEGRRRTGMIEAADDSAARRQLRSRSLIPVALLPAKAAGVRGTSMTRSASIGGRTLALITRQLATLLESGVRIDEALGIIARQSTRPRAAPLLLGLRAEIGEGRTLAAAMAEQPQVFSGFYRASIAAAEESNRLGPVLSHLAEHVETQQRNRQGVQLALLYPALLAGVSLIVVILLLTFVVPDIARVFAQRGEALPFLTRMMISGGDFAARWGWAVLLCMASAYVAFHFWLSRSGNREVWHRGLATLSLTRTLVVRQEAARFAGTMATLIQSGVALPLALDAAAGAVGNLHIRRLVGTAATQVRDGASLARSLDEQGVFPPMLIAMVASGEASAQVGPALARVAKDQQRDLDQIVSAVVALAEPGVLLLMGGFVLLMVLAILQPIVGFNAQAGAGL